MSQREAPMPGDALCGMQLLLVEDDYLLASTLQAAFELEGAAVVGSYAGVDAALDGLGKIQTVDAALLDVDLDGEMSFPVADALRERHVPVLFLTGYDDTVLPAAYNDVRRCR